MIYSDLNDARLITLIQAGNHEAFATLVRRHTDRFFALALRTLQQTAEAEDAVQMVFLKLWQNPQAWHPEKNTQFTTWFYRVVLNQCHDMQRKSRPIDYCPPIELNQVGETNQDEQDSLESKQQQRWQQQCLEYAIAQLPASQKDALNLVVYVGLSQKQAADVLQVSIKALESLLVRARRSIKLKCEQLMNQHSQTQATLNKQKQTMQSGGRSS